MTKKQRVLNVIKLLKKEYPNAICSLNSSNAFELLVAVRLSAQCTDARVNLVTPSLFERYKTLDDYANADVNDIENYIKSCGFYKNKELCYRIYSKDTMRGVNGSNNAVWLFAKQCAKHNRSCMDTWCYICILHYISIYCFPSL